MHRDELHPMYVRTVHTVNTVHTYCTVHVAPNSTVQSRAGMGI
jgi:hypothetical protein